MSARVRVWGMTALLCVFGFWTGNVMASYADHSVFSNGFGKDVLYWPYFSFPPLFVVENGDLSGFGIEIQDMLMRDMPAHSHVRIAASPRRMFTAAEQGKPFVIVGALKTEEREKNMYFSLPCRLALNNLVLVRSEDVKKFSDGRSVSLKRLLADSEQRMGVISGVSYGHESDELIRSANRTEGVASLAGPQAMEQLTKMLLKKRIDFTFADPSYVAWFERRNKVSGELSLLYIEEMTKPALLGYVAVPRTISGSDMVGEINKVLRRRIRSGELENILAGWAPVSFRPELRRLYNEMIFKPVMK